MYAVLKINFDNGAVYVGKPLPTDKNAHSFTRRASTYSASYNVFETLEQAARFYETETTKGNCIP